MLVYSETPEVHTHTMKIAVVDSGPSALTFDTFRDLIAQRLPVMDPLRYRLVDIPRKLHHPMWLENCEVDLDYHLRRTQAPGDGGRRSLDEVIGTIASTPLNRDRPLWEFYFVEGLSHNRVAVVGKVHHALADGVASANLTARAMAYVPGGRVRAAAPDPLPTSRELIGAAARDHITQIGRLPGLVGYTATGMAKVIRNSVRRKRHPSISSGLNAP